MDLEYDQNNIQHNKAVCIKLHMLWRVSMANRKATVNLLLTQVELPQSWTKP